MLEALTDIELSGRYLLVAPPLERIKVVLIGPQRGL
jgi:hypothetical protein